MIENQATCYNKSSCFKFNHIVLPSNMSEEIITYLQNSYR